MSIARAFQPLSGHRTQDARELRGEGLPARVGAGRQHWLCARSADSSPCLSPSLPPTWELRAWNPDELRGQERRAWGLGRPLPASPSGPAGGLVLGAGIWAKGAGGRVEEPDSRWGSHLTAGPGPYQMRLPGQGRAISPVPLTGSAHLTRGHPDGACPEAGISAVLGHILVRLG